MGVGGLPSLRLNFLERLFGDKETRSVKGVKVSLEIKRWCLRGSGRGRRLRCVIVTRGRWRGEVVCVCEFSLENEG